MSSRQQKLGRVAVNAPLAVTLVLVAILSPFVSAPATNVAAIAAAPAAQLGNRFTEQLASQLTQPAAPVTAAAQPPVALQGAVTTTVYLPIVFAAGQPGPSPASPYARALSQALADCAGTALNQVCYARGSVTLDGGGPLTTPGQVATLDGVSGLTLISPDASHWSVALLRLAADSLTPTLGLTLLAFGNVEIRNLTLFDAAAGNGDVAPALSFSSSPVPGQDPVTGGLIVYNPTHEEPLPIRLNGADLTLDSSAVVQAQPGDKMTVIMATGSALVNTAAGSALVNTAASSALVNTAVGDGTLIQGHQLTVPLDGNGTVAGAPTTPTAIDDDLLVPLTPTEEDDLLVPLVSPRPTSPLDIFGAIDHLLSLEASASYRCLQGNSRQVYRIMYFARMLKEYERTYPDFFADGTMDRIDGDVQKCATFEIEFNSVITRTGSLAPGDMYIQGQGMIVHYNIDGNLVQSAQMSLIHRHYNVVFPWTGCYYLKIEDGRLILHDDSYMRINRNRLDISTSVIPVDVWERLYYTCGEDRVEWANPAAWSTMFWKLHESEQILIGFHFTPDHWKYTGNQILAEAIFTRKVIEVGIAEFTGDTWLVMLHKPGH